MTEITAITGEIFFAKLEKFQSSSKYRFLKLLSTDKTIHMEEQDALSEMTNFVIKYYNYEEGDKIIKYVCLSHKNLTLCRDEDNFDFRVTTNQSEITQSNDRRLFLFVNEASQFCLCQKNGLDERINELVILTSKDDQVISEKDNVETDTIADSWINEENKSHLFWKFTSMKSRPHGDP